jgi:hypothetical protein
MIFLFFPMPRMVKRCWTLQINMCLRINDTWANSVIWKYYPIRLPCQKILICLLIALCKIRQEIFNSNDSNMRYRRNMETKYYEEKVKSFRFVFLTMARITTCSNCSKWFWNHAFENSLVVIAIHQSN